MGKNSNQVRPNVGENSQITPSNEDKNAAKPGSKVDAVDRSTSTESGCSACLGSGSNCRPNASIPLLTGAAQSKGEFGAVALPASAHGAEPAGYEHQRAIMEGERNASGETWGKARKASLGDMVAYNSGFTNGWDRRAALAAAPPAQTGTVLDHIQMALDCAERRSVPLSTARRDLTHLTFSTYQPFELLENVEFKSHFSQDSSDGDTSRATLATPCALSCPIGNAIISRNKDGRCFVTRCHTSDSQPFCEQVHKLAICERFFVRKLIHLRQVSEKISAHCSQYPTDCGQFANPSRSLPSKVSAMMRYNIYALSKGRQIVQSLCLIPTRQIDKRFAAIGKASHSDFSPNSAAVAKVQVLATFSCSSDFRNRTCNGRAFLKGSIHVLEIVPAHRLYQRVSCPTYSLYRIRHRRYLLKRIKTHFVTHAQQNVKGSLYEQ